MKILFWGSSDFSMPFLRMLGEISELAGVVTSPDRPFGRGLADVHVTPVKAFAAHSGVSVLQPQSLKAPEFRDAVAALAPDLSVVVSYGRIIPEDLLFLPRLSSVNIHASLLPKYRGASPIQAALANGDAVTGNTLQFMSKELDRGDIIARSEVPVGENDDYPSLSEKLAADGVRLLRETLPLIESGKAPRARQDDGAASFCRLLTREDGLVDLRAMTAADILNRYRAYKPWPGVHCVYRNSPAHDGTEKAGVPVILTDIAAEGVTGAGPGPGTIIRADKGGLSVRCAVGALVIRRLKPAGKKEMDHVSFINGYRPAAGNYF